MAAKNTTAEGRPHCGATPPWPPGPTQDTTRRNNSGRSSKMAAEVLTPERPGRLAMRGPGGGVVVFFEQPRTTYDHQPLGIYFAAMLLVGGSGPGAAQPAAAEFGRRFGRWGASYLGEADLTQAAAVPAPRIRSRHAGGRGERPTCGHPADQAGLIKRGGFWWGPHRRTNARILYGIFAAGFPMWGADFPCDPTGGTRQRRFGFRRWRWMRCSVCRTAEQVGS